MITARTIQRCLIGSILVVGLGCAGTKPEPAEGGSSTASPAAQSLSNDGTRVSVAPELRELCDLPTPRFGFDRADARDAHDTLRSLATCLTTGPAKGKRLNLVGHADPRGELEYNFGLGQRRSGWVASLLTEYGVSSDRLSPSSRGELEATGEDEEGWARDRRVEILVAQ